MEHQGPKVSNQLTVQTRLFEKEVAVEVSGWIFRYAIVQEALYTGTNLNNIISEYILK
jgi:hypothetical protein